MSRASGLLADMTFDVPTPVVYADISLLDHVCSLDCEMC